MSHTEVVLAGRYRLEGRIATGGVGEVWRAADLVLRRPVAVKLLRAEYAEHPQTLARFRAEARHAGSLSHPGIAQVYDYAEAAPPQSPYLVMELVDGPSLAGVLAAGPLDPARAMDVVAQAAAGLGAAHAAGLVHRDIKPANLLLGPGGQVKITDFGIAHAAGSAPVTRTGTLIGTPAYLAPERAAGGPATPASDLYSLGVVAYECLAGAPPFSGIALEVAAAHRQRPLPPLPSAVPEGMAALVAELTAKDPAARPASAGMVGVQAGRLRDAVAEGTVFLASPPSPTLADAQPPTLTDAGEATLADAPVPGRLAGYSQRRRGWPSAGRGVLLAVVAAAVTAGLAGWLLAGAFAAGPHYPATQTTAAAPRASAAGMAEVNGAALVGQPVSVVRQQLSQLGLQPRMVLVPARDQAPGTVMSVQPTGEVPAGSVVVVTVAAQPHGHGHGHGKDNGGD